MSTCESMNAVRITFELGSVVVSNNMGAWNRAVCDRASDDVVRMNMSFRSGFAEIGGEAAFNESLRDECVVGGKIELS